jgi:hypothetical protein
VTVAVENLWIGVPGQMREVAEQASSYTRPRDLGTSVFRSLAGRATLTRARDKPRETTVAWSSLLQDDFDHLVELATAPPRWFDTYPGAGEVIGVIDPTVRNALSAAQSRGRPPSGPIEATIADAYTLTGTGALTRPAPGGIYSVGVQPAVAGDVLTYRHGYWPGWPVAPGMTVSLVGSPVGRGGSQALWAYSSPQLVWLSESGFVLGSGGTVTGTPGAGATPAVVTGAAPAGAVWVSPRAVIGASPPSSLIVTDTVLAYALPDEVSGWPLGEGSPAYAIRSYDDTPALGTRERGISLDLVEVHGSATR